MRYKGKRALPNSGKTGRSARRGFFSGLTRKVERFFEFQRPTRRNLAHARKLARRERQIELRLQRGPELGPGPEIATEALRHLGA